MFLSNPFLSDPRVYKEAIFLVSMGYKVEIVCWNRNKEFLKNEIIDGIEVTRLHYPSKTGKGILKQIIPYFQYIFEIRKIITKSTADFFHFHDLDTGISLLTLFKKKKQIILDLHEQPDKLFKGFIKKIVKIIMKTVIKKADYVIIVNETQKLEYKDYYINKEVVELRNLPEEKVFGKYIKENSENIRISFIGSVRDAKSLSTLIESFKEDSNIIINIVGAGTAQKLLFQKYREIKNVNFVGGFVYKDIIKYYEETDVVFAMYDTNNENFNMAIPVKVFEAIICGIPVIVSKGTAVGKFVEINKIGIAVSNAEELILGVNKLSDKIFYNQCLENINLIKNDYIWESEVKNLKKIYG